MLKRLHFVLRGCVCKDTPNSDRSESTREEGVVVNMVKTLRDIIISSLLLFYYYY